MELALVPGALIAATVVANNLPRAASWFQQVLWHDVYGERSIIFSTGQIGATAMNNLLNFLHLKQPTSTENLAAFNLNGQIKYLSTEWMTFESIVDATRFNYRVHLLFSNSICYGVEMWTDRKLCFNKLNKSEHLTLLMKFFDHVCINKNHLN